MITKIEVVDFEIAYDLSLKIPEFSPIHYSFEVWKERLQDTKHISLVAFHEKKAVGFKVGYYIEEETFYSWMGGVLPNYRQEGIGKDLAFFQENILKNNKVKWLTMKTRNRNQAMLIMAIKNNFKITKVESKNDIILDHRIYLQKQMKA